MRIITLETLKSMPNGTAFCQIDKWGNYEGRLNILTGRYEDRTGFNGIMELLPWSPDGDEYTNIHMFGDNQELIKDKDFPAEWVTTDTAHHDFEPNQLFMVFSKAEVQKMIQALQWALSGLEGDFDGEIGLKTDYLFVDDIQLPLSDTEARELLNSLEINEQNNRMKAISGTFGTFSVKDFEKIMGRIKDV